MRILDGHLINRRQCGGSGVFIVVGQMSALGLGFNRSTQHTEDCLPAAGVLQMERRPRIYYSDAQKALMWERW
ncbi:hypothetical protein, partial [Stenotrophomonas sp. PS02300]|uniref:hypothetical protein n=1 Tax=Stenotrophomonas sp. PS02300 TaxID=2991426 RepID=UPI00249A02FC